MCFVQEGEWTADVVEESTRTADKPTHCHECCRTIPVGGTVHETDYTQYEECRTCSEGDCACVRDGDGDCDGCECAEPYYGETDHWQRCADCERFLDAVAEAEKEAGCGAHESRPMSGMMVESIREGGTREAFKYFKAAVRMYPALRTSGYLAFLWRKLFVN